MVHLGKSNLHSYWQYKNNKHVKHRAEILESSAMSEGVFGSGGEYEVELKYSEVLLSFFMYI